MSQVLTTCAPPQYVSLRRVGISKPSKWVTKCATISSLSISASAPLRNASFCCTSSVQCNLPSSPKIFVKGLPLSTSEGRLVKVFSEFGEVTLVQLPIDKESGQSLGFAYIWFVKEESAQLAVQEMNGKVYLCYNCKAWIIKKFEDNNSLQILLKSLMGKVQGFSLLCFGGCFDSCPDHTQGSGYGTRIWNLRDWLVELQIRVGSVLKKICMLKLGSFKRLKFGGSLKSLLYYYDEYLGCHSLRMVKQQYIRLEDLRDSSEMKIFWDHQRGCNC
ncbi:Glycine-rich RNA-binding protein 4, mitochondrial [Mucuna pruriens]|uniref:Glycine-rich RNA-binding protein 4, mitochondrial n=1 Tax=Mucuna pruriens TaxID=157652 RepID=A0A371DZK5_MUCPR|nr:Glycine-rich RNA-binding protein 4, mitochondrial [Mucuna pruriens]